MRKKYAGSILAAGLSLALLGIAPPLVQAVAAPIAATASTPVTQTSVYGIQLGMTAAQVEQILGQPARKDPSTTGVEWWIYNRDLNHYIQVGIQNAKVATLFTNGANARVKGMGIGSTTAELPKAWGAPPSSLAITPTLKINGNTLGHPSYSLNNQIVTFSIDQLGGGKIAGIRLSTPDYFSSIAIGLMYPISYTRLPAQPVLTEQQRQAAALASERENFDLLNITRARANLPLLAWDEKVATVARAHSQDMAKNNYFNHTSQTTGSPFDRLKHAGILYGYAGENIAYGQLDGVEAHMGWMNSAGHRKNLLEPHYKQVGVGISYKDGRAYYTQNFVSKM